MTGITAAENGVKKIKILESSSKLLEKVRISGGGRCNITNATWIPSDFIDNYPRGGKQLLEAFSRFATGDIFEWFELRGIKLKIENDNRVFPVSDSSLQVVNCLRDAAEKIGIKISTRHYVKKIIKDSSDLFQIDADNKGCTVSKKVLISTGGHPSGYKLAESFGHQIIKPLPSLFTFSCKEKFLKTCSGVSAKNIFLKLLVNNRSFINKGDLLITHWGFSGPGILKLSSLAARDLYETKYKCKLIVSWSDLDHKNLFDKICYLREKKGKSNLSNVRPIPTLTKRLWLFLLRKMEINQDKTWSSILSFERDRMIDTLLKDEYNICAKGPYGEEFVTSGGITLDEVNFRNMESSLCPGLYFTGEVLNIDGITGGFNFQHCWTSGWIAGHAISHSIKK